MDPNSLCGTIGTFVIYHEAPEGYQLQIMFFDSSLHVKPPRLENKTFFTDSNRNMKGKEVIQL